MLAFNFGQLVAQMTKKAIGPIAGGSFDDSPFHGPQTPGAPRGPAWMRGTGHHDKVKFNDSTPAPRTATPPAPSGQTTMQSTVPGMPPRRSAPTDLGPSQMPLSQPSFATYTPSSPRDFGANVAQQIASSDPTIGDPGLDNGLSPDAIAGMEMANAQLRRNSDDLFLASPRPLARQTPTVPELDTRVPPLPSKYIDPAPQDYAGEYDAWRASQGLSSGGPNGNLPPVPLQQLGGGEAPIKLPSGVR